MNKVNFSESNVASLAQKNKRFIVGDKRESFLSLRVSPAGQKSFYYVRTINSKTNFIKIGDWPAISVDEARKNASAISFRIAHNLPVFGESPDAPVSIKNCVEKYLAARLARRGPSRSLSISKRRIATYIPQSLLNKSVDSLKRADIETLLFSTAEKSGKRNASLLIIDLRAAINYMIKNDEKISKNPAAGVRLFPTVERSRFLSESEMSRFFSTLQNFGTDFQDVIKLLIFTGKRKENICGLQWNWIDLQEKTLTIPASSEKTGHEDITVLNECAMEILSRRHDQQFHEQQLGTFVFPSTKSKKGYFSEPSNSWEKLCRDAKIENLRIHDLRRTVGSWGAERGYSMPMIAAILGQSSTSATHIYARISTAPKREASSTIANAIAVAGKLMPPSPAESARKKIERILNDSPEKAMEIMEFLNEHPSKISEA